MSNVRVCRQTDLDEQQCQSLALELLDQLVNKFGGKYKPEGESYRLS